MLKGSVLQQKLFQEAGGESGSSHFNWDVTNIILNFYVISSKWFIRLKEAFLIISLKYLLSQWISGLCLANNQILASWLKNSTESDLHDEDMKLKFLKKTNHHLLALAWNSRMSCADILPALLFQVHRLLMNNLEGSVEHGETSSASRALNPPCRATSYSLQLHLNPGDIIHNRVLIRNMLQSLVLQMITPAGWSVESTQSAWFLLSKKQGVNKTPPAHFTPWIYSTRGTERSH